MRCSSICAVLFCTLISATPGLAQEPSPTDTRANATCTFADGKQMSVRYNRSAESRKERLPMGQVWTPGNSPMDLFTQSELTLGKSDIPVGAYRIYIIPDKKQWTLILSKNVSTGATYNQQDDLLRVQMDIGHLSTQAFKVAFGHVAPKQCNMRIYYGKTGAWTEFKEK